MGPEALGRREETGTLGTPKTLQDETQRPGVRLWRPDANPILLMSIGSSDHNSSDDQAFDAIERAAGLPLEVAAMPVGQATNPRAAESRFQGEREHRNKEWFVSNPSIKS